MLLERCKKRNISPQLIRVFSRIIKTDYSILCVNDKWLYYYFDDDEGTGNLKRVPLRKGKDKRDIMNTEHVENVRDTQYENGFTVAGDYYAGISYGQLLSCII